MNTYSRVVQTIIRNLWIEIQYFDILQPWCILQQSLQYADNLKQQKVAEADTSIIGPTTDRILVGSSLIRAQSIYRHDPFVN